MTAHDPIVPIPGYEELSPEFQARSRRGKQRLGVNVNSLHAFSHSEKLGGAARDFLESVATLTTLPNELRLLIRLAVASANQCRYCTAHQRHQLIGLGVPDAKIAALGAQENGALSPREWAAVRYAQAVTIDAASIGPAIYADLVEHFTPQEIVEVTIVATSMCMLNKCNDALRVPLESEFEALVS